MSPSLASSLLGNWEITVTSDSDLPVPTHPFYEAKPKFRGTSCLLETPGFLGEIDPHRQSAHLLAHPSATPADLCYFQRVVAALALFMMGSLMVHAAAVLSERGTLLFVGNSGAGKSTIARHAGRRHVLHDDIVALQPQKVGVLVSPLPDERHQSLPVYPLSGLLLLAHSSRPFLQPIPPAIALAELVANSPVINAAPQYLPALFSFWCSLLAVTPFYRLHFCPDASFWEVLDAQFR
ncbi:MAG: hypothetical protein GXP38_16190 [Chloroflexi bacterium]|nr:hypothetical protein [Chloroflexota bacterium]